MMKKHKLSIMFVMPEEFLVYIKLSYGSETYLREVPISVKSRIVTS